MFCFHAVGQSTHPHILVKPSDREAILEKIDRQAWAKSIFDDMTTRLQPYIDRHQSDPEWILSRYLMNRVPGKRYTHFYADERGVQLVDCTGDAPVPTVRVSPHNTAPTSKSGVRYRLPSIEELVPYDTAFFMNLQTENGEWEWANPQRHVDGINGNINQLALEAAILYWLTGNEKYAVFAADILNQWGQGAVHQYPIEGTCYTGYFCMQSLDEARYGNLILVHDFLFDFLKSKGYEMSYYEVIFKRLAEITAFHGYYNNWYAVQTSTLVNAALALDDKAMRDYYLQFVLTRDTIISNSCARYSLPTTANIWLSPDGHWKEPGGYHNFPVSHLLTTSIVLENNGYEVFRRLPAYFDASHVMLKYAFPNFTGSSYGDTGRPRQSPQLLEMGIKMAEKYNPEKLKSLLSSMRVMLGEGYKRETSGYMGLLWYVPSIPVENDAEYTWPRSGTLEFARCFVQRNGTDRQYGLMYVMQGGTYGHNHVNGMSMELYGAGRVMGIDPGNGATYTDPIHIDYYAQWAAHNTVAADAKSASTPYFRGGGGKKNIGDSELSAMEPMAERQAVSPWCSFTDTRYTDNSTATNQQRTMAIVRTSDTTGYYLDIFRSDNKASNQYVYHNIGNSLLMTDAHDKPLSLRACTYPESKTPADPAVPADQPGFRMMKDYQTSGIRRDATKAVFAIHEPAPRVFMQMLMPGEADREYMTAQAPPAKTTSPPYNREPTPTVICQQHGEAWTRPFVAVYEPYHGENGKSVMQVESVKHASPGTFTFLKVSNRAGSTQYIFQSVDGDMTNKTSDGSFRGAFAVVSLKGKQPEYLYLGAGRELSFGGYSLKTTSPDGAANLAVGKDEYIISCNQPTEVTIPSAKIKKLVYKTGNDEMELKHVATKAGINFTVPAGNGMQLKIIQ